MSEKSPKELMVEAWKTIVDVQQHFNDMEMRVRALCLTLLGTLLGAASYTYHQSASGGGLSPYVAYYLAWISLVIVFLFYFMDIRWYHLFLRGAVRAGHDLELRIEENGVPLNLGGSISRASHDCIWGRVILSHMRGTIFYGVLGFLSFVFIIVTRTRNPWVLGALAVLALLCFLLVYTRLPMEGRIHEEQCKHCGTVGSIDKKLFCTNCKKQHDFSGMSIGRKFGTWIAGAMFVSLALVSLLLPQRAAADEQRIAVLMSQRINYDLYAASKRILRGGELAYLQTSDTSGTASFEYVVANKKWQSLPQTARALLVGPDGWFPRETELVWEKFHNGYLCTGGADHRIQISVETASGQLLDHDDVELQSC